MYKRVNVRKLGRKKSHRESMIQNQMRTLFNNGILETTTAKAKAVKAVGQSLLSDLSQEEISLATRRKAKRILGSNELVNKAIKYVNNEEEGIRLRKVGFRSGDNAEVTRVELIGYEGKRKRKIVKKEKEEKETKSKEVKKAQQVNKDIDERTVKKTASGKASKAKRKASERARARAGL
jgi:large subunit ribosomal protein L17